MKASPCTARLAASMGRRALQPYARNRYRIADRADAGRLCERAPAAVRGLLLDRVPDDFWILPEAPPNESNKHENRPTKGARI